jgi:hypothetical protein
LTLSLLRSARVKTLAERICGRDACDDVMAVGRTAVMIGSIAPAAART